MVSVSAERNWRPNQQLSIITEVLAGAWERLEQGRADIVVAPDMHFRSSSEINSRKLYSVLSVYVAAPDHPIHQEPNRSLRSPA
jgi:DNA-binding transcriptional LysR family regulator